MIYEKGEDLATLSRSLWTLQLKHYSRVVFFDQIYYALFLQPAVTFEQSVQLVGFVFGSLLYTTDAAMSNLKQVFNCSHSDPAPSAACAETEDEDDEGDTFYDVHEQPPNKTLKGNHLWNGEAPATERTK